MATTVDRSTPVPARRQRIPMARSGGSVTRQLSAADQLAYRFAVAISCNGYLSRVENSYLEIYWKFMPAYPRVAVVRVPEQVDVVEGLQANVERSDERRRRHLQLSHSASAHSKLTARSSIGNAATTAARHGKSSRVRTRTKRIQLPISLAIPWRFWGVHSWFRCHRRRPGRADARPRLLHAAGADSGATLRHWTGDAHQRSAAERAAAS